MLQQTQVARVSASGGVFWARFPQLTPSPPRARPMCSRCGRGSVITVGRFPSSALRISAHVIWGARFPIRTRVSWRCPGSVPQRRRVSWRSPISSRASYLETNVRAVCLHDLFPHEERVPEIASWSRSWPRRVRQRRRPGSGSRTPTRWRAREIGTMPSSITVRILNRSSSTLLAGALITRASPRSRARDVKSARGIVRRVLAADGARRAWPCAWFRSNSIARSARRAGSWSTRGCSLDPRRPRLRGFFPT